MFESILIIVLGFALLGLLYYRVKSKTYQNILDMTEEEGDIYLVSPQYVNNPGTHEFKCTMEDMNKNLEIWAKIKNASDTSDLQ
jgi:hypothetical protein